MVKILLGFVAKAVDLRKFYVILDSNAELLKTENDLNEKAQVLMRTFNQL